jgi:type II secretory pathway component PulK
MKLACSPKPSSQRGSAVLVVLVLLAIMALYMAANSATLNKLRTELKVVESKQLRRYREPVNITAEKPPATTNRMALATAPQ